MGARRKGGGRGVEGEGQVEGRWRGRGAGGQGGKGGKGTREVEGGRLEGWRGGGGWRASRGMGEGGAGGREWAWGGSQRR